MLQIQIIEMKKTIKECYDYHKMTGKSTQQIEQLVSATLEEELMYVEDFHYSWIRNVLTVYVNNL